MHLEETITINANIDYVYHVFYNLELWRKVLSDVLDVDVLYQDENHQEFTMTVERPLGSEKIRGIRFCIRNKEIQLFQPSPPPGFKTMIGSWKFEKINKFTKIVATRDFLLEEKNTNMDDLYSETKNYLSNYLRNNLYLFKSFIEGSYDH